ncbi:hypothetical protein ACFPRA_15345 [Sporosarcina soli]|uniref:Uncharacterized protein n=1 Tax=Sporosarcina soli TaxID=334736 RepID=A0ABW0TPE0_9BACL
MMKTRDQSNEGVSQQLVIFRATIKAIVSLGLGQFFYGHYQLIESTT